MHFKIRSSSGKKNIERGGWGKNCVGYSENMLVTNVETDSAQIFTKSQQKKGLIISSWLAFRHSKLSPKIFTTKEPSVRGRFLGGTKLLP